MDKNLRSYAKLRLAFATILVVLSLQTRRFSLGKDLTAPHFIDIASVRTV